jgi:hypothetical protein
LSIFTHHAEGALAETHDTIDQSDSRDHCIVITGIDDEELRIRETFVFGM